MKMHKISGFFNLPNENKVVVNSTAFTYRGAIDFINQMNRKGDELFYDGEIDVTDSLMKEK